MFWKLNDKLWRLPIKYCTGTNQDFLLPNLRRIAFNKNIEWCDHHLLIRIKIQWTSLVFCISIFITTLPRRASRQGAPRGASWRMGRRRRRRLPALCTRQTWDKQVRSNYDPYLGSHVCPKLKNIARINHRWDRRRRLPTLCRIQTCWN